MHSLPGGSSPRTLRDEAPAASAYLDGMVFVEPSRASRTESRWCSTEPPEQGASSL